MFLSMKVCCRCFNLRPFAFSRPYRASGLDCNGRNRENPISGAVTGRPVVETVPEASQIWKLELGAPTSLIGYVLPGPLWDSRASGLIG